MNVGVKNNGCFVACYSDAQMVCFTSAYWARHGACYFPEPMAGARPAATPAALRRRGRRRREGRRGARGTRAPHSPRRAAPGPRSAAGARAPWIKKTIVSQGVKSAGKCNVMENKVWAREGCVGPNKIQ